MSKYLGPQPGLLFMPILIYILIANPACNSRHVLYAEEAKIGGNGWAYSDSISFAFTVADTQQLYDLMLDVKHDKDYAWENAYVRIRTVFPNDSTRTDVTSLELAGATGAWKGHCSGADCNVEIPLQRRFRFRLPGTYGLTFVQFMRQDIVPGIRGLGLSVTEAQK